MRKSGSYSFFTISLFGLFILCGITNCNTKTSYKSPSGYDFKNAQKFIVPQSLHEISGITFIEEKMDTLYAIDDEAGKLFSFSLKTEKLNQSKFSKKGDYEDVTTVNETTVAVLRSDGSIFLFPVGEIGKEKMETVYEYASLLPAGEYEGLFGQDRKLFALCKNCPADKEKSEVSVYTLELNGDTALRIAGSLKIDISGIQPKDGKPKVKFHPSGISKNPVTQEWFIISSVNKLLLIVDENWRVKEFFPLDPALFKQPEGIAFNSKGDLYISNEGGDGAANVLLFSYQKQ